VRDYRTNNSVKIEDLLVRSCVNAIYYAPSRLAITIKLNIEMILPSRLT